jgi:TPR repeat protein
LPLAEAGNVDAQIYLGQMHDRGASGVRGDVAEAIRWYRKAAEQGDAGAQYWLGWFYQSHRFDGNGRPVNDYAESVRWLKAAAEQGHPDAQLELGNAYREGRGVVRDEAQQGRWYQASHRNKDGASRLIQQPQCAAVAGLPVFAAVFAACNRGDEGETSRQLTVLAKQGNAQAQNWLGYLYYQGLPGARPGTAPHPTTTSGDLFQGGARWIRSAAEQGYAPAQYNLGVVSEHGMGVAANPTDAIRWYRAAARQKSAEAQAALKRLGQSRPLPGSPDS